MNLISEYVLFSHSISRGVIETRLVKHSSNHPGKPGKVLPPTRKGKILFKFVFHSFLITLSFAGKVVFFILNRFGNHKLFHFVYTLCFRRRLVYSSRIQKNYVLLILLAVEQNLDIVIVCLLFFNLYRL